MHCVLVKLTHQMSLEIEGKSSKVEDEIKELTELIPDVDLKVRTVQTIVQSTSPLLSTSDPRCS